MSYILYCPEKVQVWEQKALPNGTTVPRKELRVGARALYRHRYTGERQVCPLRVRGTQLTMLRCKTLDEALEEQDALLKSTGEKFEIRDYNQGYIGRRVDI